MATAALRLLVPFLFLFPPIAATGRAQLTPTRPALTDADIEGFLASAPIVGESALAPDPRRSQRVTLDDGKRRHAATVDMEIAGEASPRNYRLNVAAYEFGKALGLPLVVPAVARTVNGRPASVTWWVDDVLMDEVSRRKAQLRPPDADIWDRQMQAVRVFDELVANAYRDVSPASYSSTVWDNLLITRQWTIRLIDHTRTFGTSRQLEHPESLTRCDRTMLVRLRGMNAGLLKQTLGKLLRPDQLEALEARRTAVLAHFDQLIVRSGEAAVLYDLPREP